MSNIQACVIEVERGDGRVRIAGALKTEDDGTLTFTPQHAYDLAQRLAVVSR